MGKAMKLGIIVAVSVLVAASQTAVGQYEWRPGEGVCGTDGVVYAVALWDPDGAGPQSERLVIGGAYIVAGTAVANRIVTWDGTDWQALGSGMNNTVYALTVYNGQLVAGGSFTTAGGVACNGVACWDGTSWQPLGIGVSGGYVSSLAVYNGELIVGGTFTAAGGVGRSRIARWDSSTWQGLGTGMTGTAVSALTVYSGQLIAGGSFTAAGGVACSNIASWDGFTWQPVDAGISGGSVSALTVYGGQLVAGGSFTTAGGVACKCVARWDGSVWQPLGGGITTGSNVYALEIYNGLLIVGGNFTAAGGVSCQRLASWDGSSWQPVDGGMSGTVNAVGVYNGQLIAGGSFTVAGGASCMYVGRYNGSVWQPLYNGMNGVVYALTVYNGDLIAGGTFTSASGVVCNCIARRVGSSWQAMGSGMNAPVSVLGVYDGQLIAGGSFTTAGGDSCNRIAAWNGATWQPLDGGTNNSVSALTVWNDLLIVGGAFTSAGGDACKYIASWDGSGWQPLVVDTSNGTNNSVTALGVYNGQLIAGGYFTLAGTTTCNRIASWDGSAWQPLGTGMNDSVGALTVYNGELVAGGAFTTAGGVGANYIARWNGSTWQILDGGTNGAVTTLTVYNGNLIAGGSFGGAGGVTCRTVALWDGSTWQPLGEGLNGSTMSALTVYNGELVVGDNFTIADLTKVSAYWARWGPVMPTILEQPVSQSVLVGDPVTFSVSAIGAGTLSYQWRKDGEPLADGGTISGATAAVLTISAVAAGDAGSYDCVVTNYAGAATSDAATLTVTVPITITTQPASQSVQVGNPVAFSVVASAAGTLSYQWRKDGSPLSDGGAVAGATTSTLTIDPVALANAGSYDVVVSLGGDSVTSLAASLTILGAESTPTGSEVGVELVDPSTGYSCATVTFQDVTSAGLTAVATAAPGPGYGPPEGFKVGQPPVVYQLETTATFSGTIEVCFNYGNISYGREQNLRLFHFDGGWVDVTTSLDTVNKRICGQVTHLSAFGVFEKLNTAPTVTITAPSSGHVQSVDTDVTLAATISDPDTGDTHTATWTLTDDYWGTQEIPGTVNGTSIQNVIQLSHAGIYHISVTVIDEDGATGTSDTVNNEPPMPAFVVIYDPDGGFVTGGGWIWSPADSLRWVPDEINNTEGKASFGFVAKYQKGASVPSGSTEFQFHAGNFQFKSTVYEWLVVTGDKARYSGWGTIEGLTGTYAFTLTAIDKSSGDKFRIKIWDEATGHVIYDNKRGQDDDADPTLIGGGSIIIHS